jgi:hypothetical protein
LTLTLTLTFTMRFALLLLAAVTALAAPLAEPEVVRVAAAASNPGAEALHIAIHRSDEAPTGGEVRVAVGKRSYGAPDHIAATYAKRSIDGWLAGQAAEVEAQEVRKRAVPVSPQSEQEFTQEQLIAMHGGDLLAASAGQ